VPFAASSQGGFAGPGRYEIANVRSGKVVDLDRNNQTGVIQFSTRGTDNQQWDIIPAPDGFWFIRNLIEAGNPLPWIKAGPLTGPAQPDSDSRHPNTVAHYLFPPDTTVIHRSFLSGLHESFGVLWPITLGLAAAFLVMFVTVPALKIASIVRRREQEQVPLVTHSSIYHDAAALIVATLDRHGYNLQSATPGWWISVPTRILLKMGGSAYRGYVPDRLEYFRDGALEAALYPNGLLLRGPKERVMRAHGLVSEALSHSDALQTMDPQAQTLEKRIHSLWDLFDRDPIGNVGAEPLRNAVDALALELGQSDLAFEDWQILYRELLQLDREIEGKAPLIDGKRTLHELHQHHTLTPLSH